MGRILEMDDISKGMFLTVLRGKTTNRMVNGPNGPISTVKEDKSFNGKILRIVAVDMPFIVVEYFFMTTRYDLTKKTIDARNVVLGTLSPEYMAAAEPRWKIPITTMFNGDPEWTYAEWEKQAVEKDIKRPDSYKENELLNSL